MIPSTPTKSWVVKWSVSAWERLQTTGHGPRELILEVAQDLPPPANRSLDRSVADLFRARDCQFSDLLVESTPVGCCGGASGTEAERALHLVRRGSRTFALVVMLTCTCGPVLCLYIMTTSFYIHTRYVSSCGVFHECCLHLFSEGIEIPPSARNPSLNRYGSLGSLRFR